MQEIIKIHLFQEKCRQNENLLRLISTESKIVKQDHNDDKTIKQGDVDFEDTIGCYSDSDTERKKPVRQKIKSTRFSCHDCSIEFTTKDKLRLHRKQVKHPEVRNHSCSICSKMFTSSKLREHMRAHTKEKPYVCSVCSQGFSMSGNLKRHMMTHTGERPHVCEFCGKGE